MQPDDLKLFEALPDNYLVLSPGLSILTASDAYLKLTGKEREAITGRYFFDVFTQKDTSAPGNGGGISSSLEEVVRTLKPHELPVTKVETPGLQERYWRTSNTPVTGIGGILKYIIHRTEDVTESVSKEKQLEQALFDERAASARARLQSEQMERLFQDIPVQIAIVRGPDLIYDYVNPQYHRELFPGRDVIGLPLLAALPEVEGQPIWDILQWVYNSGEPFIENELLIPLAAYTGGPLTDHYFNTVYQPLTDEHGETYAVLSFKYEVTTHVEARKKLEASEEKLLEANDKVNVAFAELQAIHEELKAANEEMTATNEELQETQDRLTMLNAELEARVAERTQALAESVEEQQGLNEEISSTNEELSAANEELRSTIEELGSTQDLLEQSLHGLAESQQRFQNLVRDASTGIILLTGPEMKVEIVNEAYGRLISRTPEELQGQLLFDIIPDAEAYFRPIIESVLTTGEPVYLYDTPYLVYKDGQPIEGYLNVVYQPYRENDGSVTGVMALCQDVTRQIDARKKLEESEKRFSFMLNAIPQQVWTAKPDGALDYVNKVVADDFGYDQAVIVGHGWQKFIHPEDLADCLKAWQASLKTGAEYVTEFRLLMADGSYCWHLARAVPYCEDDKILLWLGTNTDINLQKNNEQKKDEFLSIASHELRTPLTSIKLFNQLMQRVPQPEPISGYIKKSADHIYRLEKLIIDLLDVTRINSGKMNYRMEPFDFSDMVASSVEAAQQLAPDYQFVIESNAGFTVTGDRIRLEQVLQNFLSNAVKYSPDNKRVLINARKEEDCLVVSVRDFGIGITKEHLDKLFDRYYRVDNTAMRFEGLGLGLFIAAEILNHHEGTFWIESTFGEGTTFFFRLPVKSGEVNTNTVV
jgi:PAS domain S-box-containing protein